MATTSLQCVDYLSFKFGAQSLRDCSVAGPAWSFGIPNCCFASTKREKRKEKQKYFVKPRISKYQKENNDFVHLQGFKFRSDYGSVSRNFNNTFKDVNSNFDSCDRNSQKSTKIEDGKYEKRRNIEHHPDVTLTGTNIFNDEDSLMQSDKRIENSSQDPSSDSEQELIEIYTYFKSKETRHADNSGSFIHRTGNFTDDGFTSPRKRDSTESLDILDIEADVEPKRKRPVLNFEKMQVASTFKWNSTNDVSRVYFMPISTS